MTDPILILHRYTAAQLYQATPAATTLRAAVIEAVGSDADLRGANLRGANLGGANLGDANLGDADLGDANLGDADLRGADLRGADLRGANLGGANLGGANLGGANLGGANLGGANLGGANLGGANLGEIRKDFEARLALAPAEVLGLLVSLRLGRIDGSSYTGECACFVGTIANICGKSFASLGALQPDSNSPTERWFLALQPGHAPATSQVAEITERWIVEWLRANRPEAAAALDADDAIVTEQKALGDRRVELAAKEDAPGLRQLIKNHVVIPATGSFAVDSESPQG